MARRERLGRSLLRSPEVLRKGVRNGVHLHSYCFSVVHLGADLSAKRPVQRPGCRLGLGFNYSHGVEQVADDAVHQLASCLPIAVNPLIEHQ